MVYTRPTTSAPDEKQINELGPYSYNMHQRHQKEVLMPSFFTQRTDGQHDLFSTVI